MATILLLDDKTRDVAVLGDVLRREGHDVVACGDGEAGLRLQREHRFDLVLLDLALPRKGGSRTLVDLVTEFPEVRVLVTARGPETISTRAYLDIAHDHGDVRALPKPFTTDHFLRGVSVMLTGGEWAGTESQ